MKTSETLIQVFENIRPHINGHNTVINKFLQSIKEVEELEKIIHHPIRQHHLIELEALYAESKITHSRMVEILNEIAAGGHKNGIEL